MYFCYILYVYFESAQKIHFIYLSVYLPYYNIYLSVEFRLLKTTSQLRICIYIYTQRFGSFWTVIDRYTICVPICNLSIHSFLKWIDSDICFNINGFFRA